MRGRKHFRAILALTIVFFVIAYSAQAIASGAMPGAADRQLPYDEIARAVELGIANQSATQKLSATLHYQDFCEMADRLITILFPEKRTAWEARSASFRDADEPMSRMEGAIAFLYAAECMGLDVIGYEYNIPLEEFMPDGLDFWQGVTNDYPLLDGWTENYQPQALQDTPYRWRYDYSYLYNAAWFVEYHSYGNGKTYFDYDEDYRLNLSAPFTYEAAIRALERLYETGLFAKYVPVAEVSYRCPEAVALNAAKLPQASQSALPDWHGCTVASRSWCAINYAGMYYEEEEIKTLAECGFTFVRVPLQSGQFFNGEDFSAVNPQGLQNLNQLIAWCAEYGLHVCIDLHDMPGFNTGGDNGAIDLFDNPIRAQQFADFWSFFAKYYQEVPTNLLSFNLLNEPHAFDALESGVYAQVMRPAIEAVRAVSPERILFVDMIDFINGAPVKELVDTGVAQSFHPYFLNGTVTRWPSGSINGFIHKKKGTLTLKGHFTEQTTIRLVITMFHAQGELALLADGKSVSSLALGNEAVGENGCQFIGEEGTEGEYREFEGVEWRVTLPAAATKLQFSLSEGSWWYQVSSIVIENPGQTYEILGNNQLVPSEAVPLLTLNENGAIKAKDKKTYVQADKERLLQQYRALAKFRKKTGIQIMAQEFGFAHTISQNATLAATADLLAVLKELEIPWCCWCQDFAPVMDGREIAYSLSSVTNPMDMRREGSVYVPISQNWMSNQALLNVYQPYMQ